MLESKERTVFGGCTAKLMFYLKKRRIHSGIEQCEAIDRYNNVMLFSLLIYSSGLCIFFVIVCMSDFYYFFSVQLHRISHFSLLAFNFKLDAIDYIQLHCVTDTLPNEKVTRIGATTFESEINENEEKCEVNTQTKMQENKKLEMNLTIKIQFKFGDT